MADVWSYFQIAGKLAIKKKDKRNYYLACLGLRNDGTLIASANGSPWNEIVKSSHAEARAANKLDYHSDIWVVRIKISTGEFGMARPCKNCMRILLNKQVDKIYYTKDHTSYGLITCHNGSVISEKIYDRIL